MKINLSSLRHAYKSLRHPVADPIEPTEVGVRYLTVPRPGVPPLADIYVPAQPTGASAILVHGGAFVIGSRQVKPVRFLASRLCSAGVSVCAVDYRLIFRGGALNEGLDDVRAAFGFWRGRVPELGLDPARISLVGLSAGATLAMLAATRETELARVVGCFGLYDLDHLRGRLAEVLPRLLFRTPDRTQWKQLPVHTGHPAIPTLLMHGDDDGVVPVEQSRRLAAAREALGLPTRLVVYEGAPHGFFNVPSHARDEGVREIIEHVR